MVVLRGGLPCTAAGAHRRLRLEHDALRLKPLHGGLHTAPSRVQDGIDLLALIGQQLGEQLGEQRDQGGHGATPSVPVQLALVRFRSESRTTGGAPAPSWAPTLPVERASLCDASEPQLLSLGP